MRAKDMVELDETDHKILAELQHDARASFKAIAQKIGVSEATVFVRVKKLQEKGVIKAFQAILDPPSVGKNLTAIVLVRANPKAFPGTLEALKKFDDVYEIYDVTGEYYCILKIRTSGTEELGRIMDKVGAIDGIAGTDTIVVLRTVKEVVEMKL